MTQDILVLSDLTVDYDQFMIQFNNHLANKPVWKGQLTTQTSQTLMGLVSTVGTHLQSRLLRAHEDSFAETAQSDDAIRSIAQMQGLRLTRKTPAILQDAVKLLSPFDVTLGPYTQFTVAGQYYFNREQITLTGNVESTHTLYQGYVQSFTMSGIGAHYQNFVSAEDGFQVSDADTQIRVNGAIINKANGGLWNYRGQSGFSDLTLADGRLLVQFGNDVFGTVPQVNDSIILTYVLTDGDAGNSKALSGKRIIVDGFNAIEGIVTANPSGGADEKPVVVYKNVASGSFGTNLSGVTKSQYISLVATYPGILDAITQAQREIDPMDLNWMNVIRVSAITNSPWTQAQKKKFCSDMEKVTMYSPRFYWQDSIPVDRDLDIDVFVFNTAIPSQVEAQSRAAVTKLFEPKPGLLLTDLYESDLDSVIKNASRGKVSYVIVNAPTYPMIVNSPNAAEVEWSIIPGGGTLGSSVYGYSVSVITDKDEGSPNRWTFPQIISSTSDNAIKLRWKNVPGAVSYTLFGRLSSQGFGTMVNLPATNAEYMEYIDDGVLVPTGGLPNTITQSPIRYNRLRSLKLRVFFADRQQKMDGTPQRSES